MIILLVPLVAVVTSRTSYIGLLFTDPKWNMFGTASLWIYLSHWRIINIIANHFNNWSFKKCFVIVWILVAMLSFIQYGIYRIIKSNGSKIKSLFIKTE